MSFRPHPHPPQRQCQLLQCLVQGLPSQQGIGHAFFLVNSYVTDIVRRALVGVGRSVGAGCFASTFTRESPLILCKIAKLLQRKPSDALEYIRIRKLLYGACLLPQEPHPFACQIELNFINTSWRGHHLDLGPKIRHHQQQRNTDGEERAPERNKEMQTQQDLARDINRSHSNLSSA